MSTLKTNNVQVGQSATATNNFTLYQPAIPDGTVRLGVGNSGATTADVITATSAGAVTLAGALSGTTGSFSGNMSFNSGYGSAAVAYGCRAWATFNGTTSPATLNASGGITSMTKNSTGNYTVNFSFTFPDANYAAYFGIAGGGGGGNAAFVGCVVTTTQYGAPTNKTTTVCQIQTNDYTATPRDFTQAYVAFFR